MPGSPPTASASQAGRPQASARLMMSPSQMPPVERLYLRPLVGKQGKPASRDEKRGAAKGSDTKATGGDYFVQLATFHVGPNRSPR